MNDEMKVAQINGSFALKSALINGVCVIVSALLSIISININIKNNKLEYDYEILKNENSNLQSQIENLSIEYVSLDEENISLKNQISQLKYDIKSTTEPTDYLDTGNNVFIQVIDMSVRVRSAPTITSDIVTLVQHGTKYLLIDTVSGTDGNEWYQVLIENEMGYIRSDLATLITQ